MFLTNFKRGRGIFEIVVCDLCGNQFDEYVGEYYTVGKEHYCIYCLLSNKIITQKEYDIKKYYDRSHYKYGLNPETLKIERVIISSEFSWKRTPQQDRVTKSYRQWRKDVLKRDNNTCIWCGSKNRLEAHHIQKFSEFKHLRNEVSNGVTLCHRCHKAIHSKGK